jgi:hypothetical protein
MGGNANVVKKAVAPAKRSGSFFFSSVNASFNILIKSLTTAIPCNSKL